jgi:hypothetical protein
MPRGHAPRTSCIVLALGTALALCDSIVAQDSRPALAALERDIAEMQALVKARRFEDAWKKGAGLRTALETATPDLQTQAALLIAIAGVEAIGPAAAFKGVVAIRDKEKHLVEVAYDFRADGWQADFELLHPLPAAELPYQKNRTVEGTGALCHTALWTEPIMIEITGRPMIPTDFGPVFIDPDETATERFLTGFLNNAYFGIKYDADRAVTPGHVLLLAGRGAVSRAKARPTQLFAKSTEPVIARLTQVTTSLSLAETRTESKAGAKVVKRVELKTATSPTSTTTLGFDLAPTQVFPRLRAGILVRESQFEVSRVVLRGRLDPEWVKQETARLRTSLGTPASRR